MLGFGNKRGRAIDEVELYVRSMFTGLLGAERGFPPEKIFADPYVMGFLQVLTTHAVANVYRFRMPSDEAIHGILEECLERIAPGSGAIARRTLSQASVPAHRLHAQQVEGRRGGAEHVRTMFTNDGIARNEHHRSFQEHVKRIGSD